MTGRPVGAEPDRCIAADQHLGQRTAPPTACMAASNDPELITVSASRARLHALPAPRSPRHTPADGPRSTPSDRRPATASARTPATRAPRGDGRWRRSAPAARDGARLVSERGSVLQEDRPRRHRQYRTRRDENRPRRRRRGRCRRVVHSLVRSPGGRPGHAGLGDTAGRVLELLGAGRSGRRDVRAR